MGAVISPNARYVGGYTAIYDTDAGNWVTQVVIIDIRNDKKYMLDPFPDTLYPSLRPVCDNRQRQRLLPLRGRKECHVQPQRGCHGAR